MGNVPFHKENEWAGDGKSGKTFSQVITAIESCISLQLYHKVSFLYIKTAVAMAVAT